MASFIALGTDATKTISEEVYLRLLQMEKVLRDCWEHNQSAELVQTHGFIALAGKRTSRLL